MSSCARSAKNEWRVLTRLLNVDGLIQLRHGWAFAKSFAPLRPATRHTSNATIPYTKFSKEGYGRA